MLPALDRVAVTAVGMLSAVGEGAAETALALRRGLAGPLVYEHATAPDDGEDAPAPVMGVPVLYKGHLPGRVLGLFAPAMQDAVRSGSLARRDVERTPLYVAVPGDLTLERDAEIVERFVPYFYEVSAVQPRAAARVVPGGGAAGLFALGLAVEALRAGDVEACFVGGVDSRLDPDVIEALCRAGRVRRGAELDGLVPGECGAVVRLERATEARKRGARLFAVVEGVARSGDLEAAVRGALAGAAPVGWALGDLNGEASRAEAWRRARAGLGEALAGAAVWAPLAHVGDVGAATGAFLLCLAAIELAGGGAPSDRALLFCAAEDGERAAAVLSKPNE